MKRRTMLKQVGVAGLGITAATAGIASAGGSGSRRVEIDGETYFVNGDVSVQEFDPDGCCPCQDPPSWCPVECGCCGPC